jgi:leucyl/phenylalanyl-tRNA--protein transferase
MAGIYTHGDLGTTWRCSPLERTVDLRRHRMQRDRERHPRCRPHTVPIYRLSERVEFPPAELAESSGLLAIGGDLRPERLLQAYAGGIFPWYSEGEPILWFSPDPRTVLVPSELRLDRGMRRTLAPLELALSLDRAFEQVIGGCADAPRREGPGTWITTDMIEAYCRLHELGYAHSAEAWQDGELVGGVYGVALGAAFSAESMFRRRSGASLAALVTLVQQLDRWRFRLVDCQMTSPHVARLGARERSRNAFLAEVRGAVCLAAGPRVWQFDDDLATMP